MATTKLSREHLIAALPSFDREALPARTNMAAPPPPPGLLDQSSYELPKVKAHSYKPKVVSSTLSTLYINWRQFAKALIHVTILETYTCCSAHWASAFMRLKAPKALKNLPEFTENKASRSIKAYGHHEIAFNQLYTSYK